MSNSFVARNTGTETAVRLIILSLFFAIISSLTGRAGIKAAMEAGSSIMPAISWALLAIVACLAALVLWVLKSPVAGLREVLADVAGDTGSLYFLYGLAAGCISILPMSWPLAIEAVGSVMVGIALITGSKGTLASLQASRAAAAP